MRAAQIIASIEWAADVHPATRREIEDAILALDTKAYGGNRPTFDELVVHRRLEEFVSRHGTASAAAVALGISKSYMHEIRAGHRPVSDTVLTALGIEQVKVARKYRSL